MTFDCFKLHKRCQAICCQICPIDNDIWERNQDKIIEKPESVFDLRMAVLPITKSKKCPFLNKDLSCNIYLDRPEVCQKFGDESHPMLFCPFQDKNGNERP